jgi:hypothetical protein
MKTYAYSTTTQVRPEPLFEAIADIARWPEWDPDIEATVPAAKTAPGARFTLKPKGGPKVAMEIVEAQAPGRFVDLSHLPLAKMRTSHIFTAQPDGTRVDVVIEVWGLLGFLWDRVVARPQAAGAAAQTAAFVAYAARRA